MGKLNGFGGKIFELGFAIPSCELDWAGFCKRMKDIENCFKKDCVGILASLLTQENSFSPQTVN